MLDNDLFFIFTPCDHIKFRHKYDSNKFILQMRIGAVIDICYSTFIEVCDYAISNNDIQLEYLIKFMQHRNKYIEETNNASALAKN